MEEDNNLYFGIEHLIIKWNIDGTKTAGYLTRQIIDFLNKRNNNRLSELEEDNKKLRFMVENGLGEKDLDNDCI